MDKNYTIDHFWEKVGFVPNDAQRQAILHTDGPLLLTAGPGSGKTRVLLWRVVNLVVFQEVPPEKIFLSTFTEKAALQLTDGLRNLLGIVTGETGKSYDISRMAVGTVHSLCQRLVVDRRFNPGHERQRAPRLIDDLGQYLRVYERQYWQALLAAGGLTDQQEAQKAIINYFVGGQRSGRHEAVTYALAAFNRFSEENIDPKVVETSDPILKALLAMYAKYKDDLESDGSFRTVDFALLQQCAFKYFLSHEASKSVFSHVIIDEYQDTNSIQEKIFFRLAMGSKNLCVVGDDDQALYRFRGATVENLVQFESRCRENLGISPRRLDLSVNYRSRPQVVDLYRDFIDRIDWCDPEDDEICHRIKNKKIDAFRKAEGPSVVTSSEGKPDSVYEEIANLVKELKDSGKVSDYNQVAFLFPAMKSYNKTSARVAGMMKAFDQLGIPCYAPRAGRFLEVEESVALFGLFMKVFGKPDQRARLQPDYVEWIKKALELAGEICESDPVLTRFLADRAKEVDDSGNDHAILKAFCEASGFDLKSDVPSGLTRKLSSAPGLSERTKKALQSSRVNNYIRFRQNHGNRVTISYLLNRVTALDWTILDLFYQINGFKHFRDFYDLAESGTDEGPICNLALLTQYLSRFMEDRSPILTGGFLSGGAFNRVFFSSFLYALFRRGESEFEDVENPFPKGRIPFLTIHQAKGLEFPVVVVGALSRANHPPSPIEGAVRELLGKDGEPLERISEFDTMRLFYVALSRAKDLLILPRYRGQGCRTLETFKQLLSETDLPTISDVDPVKLQVSASTPDDLGKTYSYTGDYLWYQRCPRNYMIYRKYGFVPSRSQTMFFGRLVHQTIEDIHNSVIARKEINHE